MFKIEVRASTFANGELFPAATVHDLDWLPLLRTLRSVKEFLKNSS